MTSIRQHGVAGGNAVAEKRIDFTYDAAGDYATMIRYADLAGTQLVATGTYAFNAAYELVGLTYTKGATTLASYAYAYDAAGNMTSMTTVDGATNYAYDADGQLISAGATAYTYDDNGNFVTSGNSAYTTGSGNELLSDGAYRYAYDAEGNRTVKFVDANADGQLDAGDADVTVYAWDYRNRLTEVTHYSTYANYAAGASDKIVEYAYDSFNHLIGRVIDADGSAGAGGDAETVYAYDGDQIALQFDHAGSGDATAAELSHRYFWNAQAVDQLFAEEQTHYDSQQAKIVSDAVLWALTDHENSIRDLAVYNSGTDATTVVDHRIYDAYGNLTSETAAVDCVFGYTGRPTDAATGLQNNLNRWYDPSTGRWISQDPIGFNAGDANLYRYVENSPLIWTDPWGNAVYRLNRQLNPEHKDALIPLPNRELLSHTFVYTTKPDGTLLNTYSWGNAYTSDEPTHWYQNRAEDRSAARIAIRHLKDYEKSSLFEKAIFVACDFPMDWGMKVGGDDLNEFVDTAFKKLVNAGDDSPSAHKWKLNNNCKDEASRLIGLAKELQDEANDHTLKLQDEQDNHRQACTK